MMRVAMLNQQQQQQQQQQQLSRRQQCSRSMMLFGMFFLALPSTTNSSAESPSSHMIEDMFRPLPGTEGKVDDARCDVEAVELANSQQLHMLLDDVMKTRYFSLFKVNLKQECKFWGKEGGGGKCPGAEAAKKAKQKKNPFLAMGAKSGGMAKSMSSGTDAEPAVPSCALSTEGSIPWSPTTDKVKPAPELAPKASDDCSVPSFWLDMCNDIPTEGAQFVDLQTNPERYTGFNGTKIWEAIYRENCFTRVDAVQDMCYEERVLFRMLSGMHSSINIGIALNWHPPRKGKRDSFAPNTARFGKLFKNHPDRLKNMHFAFVVMLRAMQKAGPHLLNYDMSTGESSEDFRTKKLLHRLLDSDILRSCSEVFEAFDETLLFGPANAASVSRKSWKSVDLPLDSIKHSFKGVFQNISKVLDCVTCQTCKLHGKMQLLGMGTALKVLLLPDEMVGSALSRDEVVALINTVGKFSHAITGARKLFKLDIDRYMDPVTKPRDPRSPSPLALDEKVASTVEQKQREKGSHGTTAGTLGSQQLAGMLPPAPAPMVPLQELEMIDLAVGMVARLTAAQMLTSAQEDGLIARVLAGDKTLMILARHYQHDLAKFVRFAGFPIGAGGAGVTPPAATQPQKAEKQVDAVVVGAGLAGLTAAITLVDRGGRVILIDKNKFTGGNSAYASSGINAVDPADPALGDSFDAYYNDTAESSGPNISYATHTLVAKLTTRSANALQFIRERVGLDLPNKAQLGGHSFARTYRPSTGMAGSEMVFAATKLVKQLVKETIAAGESGNNGDKKFETMFGTKMKELVLGDDGSVVGIKVEQLVNKVTGEVREETIMAPSVVLATGGYASDSTGETSLLTKYRPDVAQFATTNGAFATGDGHKAALKVGAKGIDLDHVQVHPTAFVDPKHPDQPRLTLAAELLRGVGGLLLTKNGKRFADELGKRSYVTGRMMEEQPEQPHFTLLLTEVHANIANKHVPHYIKKGLLTKLDTLADVAAWMKVDASELDAEMDQYHKDAAAAAAEGDGATDNFGKKFFHNPTFDSSTAPFYVGTVTPAKHYTMGGIGIDEQGRVLKEDGQVFQGLYAAGEITGGVHGVNRLGGNALTECVVFGQVVGETIPVVSARNLSTAGASVDGVGGSGEESVNRESGSGSSGGSSGAAAAADGGLRKVPKSELKSHNTEADCWVAVYGKVYDFTDFVAEHPGGIETITEFAGADGTETFDAIHSKAMLEDFDPIGILDE